MKPTKWFWFIFFSVFTNFSSFCLITPVAASVPPDSIRAIVVTIDGAPEWTISAWNQRMVSWADSIGVWMPDVEELKIGVTDPMHSKLWGSANPAMCLNQEGFPLDPLHPELLQAQRLWLPESSVVEISGKGHCLQANLHSLFYGTTYQVPQILVTTESECLSGGSIAYQGPDSLIVKAAIAYLDNHDVYWMGLNLSEYDYMTHWRGLDCCGNDTTCYWFQAERIYREAERLVIDVLWPHLESDARYAGRTVLLVTTDHGRHITETDGIGAFLNHSHGWLPDSSGCALNCAGCRDIWAAFVAPGIVKQGYVPTGTYTDDDLAPTIRYLMGFENPQEIGTPIYEILVNNPVGVGQLETESRVMRLEQNSPNPFRSETILGFRIPRPTAAEISIFDASGREVMSTGSINYEPGIHNFAWDGRDNDGELVPSGSYFYRLEASDFLQTRKMVLVR